MEWILTKKCWVGILAPPDQESDSLASVLDEFYGVTMSHVLGGLTIDLYQLITHLEATILSGWTWKEII